MAPNARQQARPTTKALPSPATSAMGPGTVTTPELLGAVVASPSAAGTSNPAGGSKAVAPRFAGSSRGSRSTKSSATAVSLHQSSACTRHSTPEASSRCLAPTRTPASSMTTGGNFRIGLMERNPQLAYTSLRHRHVHDKSNSTAPAYNAVGPAGGIQLIRLPLPPLKLPLVPLAHGS